MPIVRKVVRREISQGMKFDSFSKGSQDPADRVLLEAK